MASKEVYRIKDLKDALIAANIPAIERIRKAIEPELAYTAHGLAKLAGVSLASVQRHATELGLVSFKYGRQILYRLEPRDARAAVVRGSRRGTGTR